MPEWLCDIIFPLVRWLHIVCMTLIVGGTLFFELVFPVSIDDLAREQQLYAIARARLLFRWVVWIAVSGLLLTGGLSIWRMWHAYQLTEFVYVSRWALAHVVMGGIAIVIAVLLISGRRPPEDPIRWMRLNLVILLVAIFIGGATRHFQLALLERHSMAERLGKVPDDLQPPGAELKVPTTAPTTQALLP